MFTTKQTLNFFYIFQYYLSESTVHGWADNTVNYNNTDFLLLLVEFF